METLERLRRKGRPRWRGSDGRLYEWDALHGEFEVYNRRGYHEGTVNAEGLPRGSVKRGRRIDV